MQISAGAFTDTTGNAFAGIDDESTLNFATASRPSYDVLITEVNSNGAGGDFVEFYNHGDAAIDLSGWCINDEAGSFASGAEIAEGTVLAAGATLVVALVNTPAKLDAFKLAWGLDDSVDTIAVDGPGLGKQDAVVLFDARGYVAAAFNYDADPVLASDGTVIGTAAASPGVTFSDNQHAGRAYGGGEKASAVWDGVSVENPTYTVAAVGTQGAYAQTGDAASIGSPGAAGVVGMQSLVWDEAA
ncbi:lamin tail domain-containing protein [Achromobacter sp. GG226]|nr:lamin tail domain-containing protein [Verticiella sp. GG226]